MHSILFQLGKVAALEEMGLEPGALEPGATEQQVPPEQLGQPGQPGMSTAEDFVEAVQNDPTEQALENKDTSQPLPPEKPIHWSGQSNLAAGDSGIKAHELGIPQPGSV